MLAQERDGPGEFVATFALIFIGAGAVIVAGPSIGNSGLVGVALAHGLVLAIMVSVTGHISGGHVNPAVTVGAWVTGQIKTGLAGVYIVAQLAGATFGALLLRAAIPKSLWAGSFLGAPIVAHPVITRRSSDNGRRPAVSTITSQRLDPSAKSSRV